MALTYQGNLSVGQCIPSLLTLNAQLQAMVNVQLPRISAQFAASIAVTPPSLVTDLIANLTQMIAAMQALLATGLVILPPAISASLSAELGATLGQLNASLAAALALQALLDSAGVHLYTYEGRDVDLPGQLSSAIGLGLPGGSETFAVVMMVNTAGTVTALKTVMGVA